MGAAAAKGPDATACTMKHWLTSQRTQTLSRQNPSAYVYQLPGQVGEGGDDRGQDSAFAQTPSRGTMLPPEEEEENLWASSKPTSDRNIKWGDSGTQQPYGNAGEDHAPIKAASEAT